MRLISYKSLRLAALAAATMGSGFAAAGPDIRLRAGVNPASEMRTPTWLGARQEIRGLRPAREALVVKGDEEPKKVVALTFDDGPHLDTTPELVAALKAADAPATFFVIGKQVDKYPSMVALEAANGFTIGNHSYSHATLTKLPAADVMTEWRACNDAIVRAGGPAPEFCRPPGGDLNRQVERSATANGLRTTLWTDDPGDYEAPGPRAILRETLSHLSDGGIVLLHDGTPATVKVLPKLIEAIRARGYRIVPLSELAVSRL